MPLCEKCKEEAEVKNVATMTTSIDPFECSRCGKSLLDD